MKVRYTDGPESLLIAQIGVKAERDEVVEVSTEVGGKLVDQGWTEVKSNAKPKKENS